MKQAAKLLLILFIFASCTEDSKMQNYPSLKTLYLDYQAGRLFKIEKYEEALAQYYALLEVDPHRPSIHSNIGVLLNMIQKPEEALKSLRYALELAEKNKDTQAVFSIQFNLGVYFGAQKKVSEALEHYQAALEVNPTSLETKTNIELLIQQQQQQGQNGENKKDPSSGQGQNNQQQNQDNKQGDQKDKKDQNQDQQDKNDQNNKNDQNKNNPDQKKQSSPKYQPRPYQGDQLSEGDVKKILGELRNQEQKIRAHFDKKEKGKSTGNEKDW